MSAVFKRPGSDEGMEMPVREVISRAILCAMFDLSEEEPLHIFNPKFEKEACLLVLDAEFTPKIAGDYLIMTESEVKNISKILNKPLAPAKRRLPRTDLRGIPVLPPWVKIPRYYANLDFLARKYEREAIEPVNVIYNPYYEQQRKPKIMKKTAAFVVVKRPGSKSQFDLTEGATIAKDMICQIFGLEDNEKYFILTPSRQVVKEFSNESSVLDKNNCFTAYVPGTYIFVTQAEMESRVCVAEEEMTPILKKSLFAKIPPKIFLKIVQKMSFRSFSRLSITCHDFLSILQLTHLKKESPLVLNVVTVPSDPDEFGLVLSKKNPKVEDAKAEFHPYYLTDLQPFVLQEIVFQGDIETRQTEECLLKGCREIQRNNIDYKTFISHFNPLPIAVEMVKMLRPKRAEIWLCRVNCKAKVIRDFAAELSGAEWPFESVIEELKLVTPTSRYLDERTNQIFPYISRLKLFQAFIVELFTPFIPQFFKDFTQQSDLENLEKVQFVYRGFNRSSFDQVQPHFEYPCHLKSDYPMRQLDGIIVCGTEVKTRIRAGIRSEDGQRIAIIERRFYRKYHVVTAVFTPYHGYKERLDRIFKQIDELQGTVDSVFRM